MIIDRALCLALATSLASACIPVMPPPPSLGYGDPYKGTGQPIYVKDSRTDWEITEGGKVIPSEHALEAAGDPEYEIRRQVAKTYNAKLYVEAQHHRKMGRLMMTAGLIVGVAGLVLGTLGPPALREVTTTPATSTMPEIRTTIAGDASRGASYGGTALQVLGLVGLAYGYFGGKRKPPYHRWRTPRDLDRPAYVRQQTEPYNEKHGAPAVAEQPGGVEDELSMAPGQRRPPPPRPTRGSK